MFNIFLIKINKYLYMQSIDIKIQSSLIVLLVSILNNILFKVYNAFYSK